MPNYIWFFSLVVLSVGLFIHMLSKKKIKEIFSIYFFISGLSFVFDYIIFVLLKSYEYDPGVFQEEWFDSVFGSSISQGMAVPAVATFLTCFNLKKKWYFIFAGIFVGIEGLFSVLDIYQLFWWHYLYTGFFLIIAFLLTNWWKNFLVKPGTFGPFFTLYLAIVTIQNTVEFYWVILFRTHFYSPGLFDNAARDHIAGNAFFVFFYALLLAVVCSRKLKWFSFIFITVYQYILFFFLKTEGWIVITTDAGFQGFILFTVVISILYRFIYVRLFQHL